MIDGCTRSWPPWAEPIGRGTPCVTARTTGSVDRRRPPGPGQARGRPGDQRQGDAAAAMIVPWRCRTAPTTAPPKMQATVATRRPPVAGGPRRPPGRRPANRGSWSARWCWPRCSAIRRTTRVLHAHGEGQQADHDVASAGRLHGAGQPPRRAPPTPPRLRARVRGGRWAAAPAVRPRPRRPTHPTTKATRAMTKPCESDPPPSEVPVSEKASSSTLPVMLAVKVLPRSRKLVASRTPVAVVSRQSAADQPPVHPGARASSHAVNVPPARAATRCPGRRRPGAARPSLPGGDRRRGVEPAVVERHGRAAGRRPRCGRRAGRVPDADGGQDAAGHAPGAGDQCRRAEPVGQRGRDGGRRTRRCR